MASVSISPIGNGYQFFTSGGLIVPLNGGLLYTYAAGTSTPTATYTDSAGSVQNTNPIVLNSDGRTPSEIWLIDGTAYKFVLKTSAGATIATYDNLSGSLTSTSSAIASVPQYVATVGGSANAISLSPLIAPSGYVTGATYTFQATATNTTAATVNVSGLGARAVVSTEGNPLTGGEIQTGGMYLIEYISGTNSFYVLNPSNAIVPLQFTPGIAFGGLSVGVTYSAVRYGAYYQIGKMFVFTMDFQLTSKGSSVGVVTLTGLPFTQSANFPTGSSPVMTVATRNVTYAAGYVAGLMSGSTISLINIISAGGFGVIDNTSCANNSEFLVTASVIAA